MEGGGCILGILSHRLLPWIIRPIHGHSICNEVALLGQMNNKMSECLVYRQVYSCESHYFISTACIYNTRDANYTFITKLDRFLVWTFFFSYSRKPHAHKIDQNRN